MGNSSHTLEAYYKRFTSPLVVLRLLRDKAMYGYEISQAMKQKSGGRFTMSVLYPVLYRLENKGCVVVERTEIINNRARSYYSITDKGRDYLVRSLEEYCEMHRVFMAIQEEA